jgi:quercetin dioxygenase-like cupin family protein
MIDERSIALTWALKGFSCGTWVDPPGRQWEDFVHDADELILVVEGELEYEIDGEVIHPEVGEELLIPAGVPHSARNIGETPARWLHGYRRAAAAGEE